MVMSEADKCVPCVSVVIPVYNAEQYLQELLEVLVNQTLTNLEFIFVDDHGQDNSFEIIREAAKSDKRIVCIDNGCNKGPGYSRNHGFKAARGEYVAFIDADDLLSPDYYELLYKTAKLHELDVVKARLRRLMPNGEYIYSRMHEFKKMNAVKPDEYIIQKFYYEHPTAIYSRKLMESTRAKYAEQVRYGEDTYFLLNLLIDVKGKQFKAVDDAFYTYRVHDESLTTVKKDSCFLNNVIISSREKMQFLLSQKDSERVIWYANYLLNQNLDSVLKSVIDDAVPYHELVAYTDAIAEMIKQWERSSITFIPTGSIKELSESGYDSRLFVNSRTEGVEHYLSEDKDQTQSVGTADNVVSTAGQDSAKQDTTTSTIIKLCIKSGFIQYNFLRVCRLVCFGSLKKKIEAKMADITRTNI